MTRDIDAKLGRGRVEDVFGSFRLLERNERGCIENEKVVTNTNSMTMNMTITPSLTMTMTMTMTLTMTSTMTLTMTLTMTMVMTMRNAKLISWKHVQRF